RLPGRALWRQRKHAHLDRPRRPAVGRLDGSDSADAAALAKPAVPPFRRAGVARPLPFLVGALVGALRARRRATTKPLALLEASQSGPSPRGDVTLQPGRARPTSTGASRAAGSAVAAAAARPGPAAAGTPAAAG